MFYVKDDFKAGAPVSQVPASWFNQVASFINNLVGGYGIKVTKTGGGSASVISLDPDVLNGDSQTGEDVELFKSVGCNSPDSDDGESGEVADSLWTRGVGGASFQVVSRIVSVGGLSYRFYLRDMKLDSTGRVRSISKEVGYFEVDSL